MRTVLCYGDSNTWGYEPKTDGRLAWEERWPGALQRLLGEGFRVIENGLCGRTTGFDGGAEPFVNGERGAKECALINAGADVAVLMLGTNDCKDEYGANREETEAGIVKIGEIFQKAGAKILVIAPAPLRNLRQSPFGEEFGLGAEEKSRGLSVCLGRAAKKKGWAFFDAGKIVQTGDFDGIHLTKEAHEKLAEKAAEMIRKMEETR